MSIFENFRIYKSVAEHPTGDTGKNRLFVSPVKYLLLIPLRPFWPNFSASDFYMFL